MATWRFALSCLLISLVPVATGQTTALVQVDALPTQGADIPWSGLEHQRFVFDLRGSDVAAPNFWTGSEISVDVLSVGAIWHATDQSLGDPNGPGFHPNNLVPPTPAPPADDTRRYDTYLAGEQYQVGPVPPNPSLIGIVSTPTRIRGLLDGGQEGPLPWSVAGQSPLNNTSLARFTFEVPAGLGLSLTQDAAHPSVFARLVGRTTASNNTAGTPFDLTIYQVPEPSAAGLIIVSGLAAIRRAARRAE